MKKRLAAKQASTAVLLDISAAVEEAQSGVEKLELHLSGDNRTDEEKTYLSILEILDSLYQAKTALGKLCVLTLRKKI